MFENDKTVALITKTGYESDSHAVLFLRLDGAFVLVDHMMTYYCTSKLIV